MFDRSIKIAPSILAADFASFGAECRAIEAQGADYLSFQVVEKWNCYEGQVVSQTDLCKM